MTTIKIWQPLEGVKVQLEYANGPLNKNPLKGKKTKKMAKNVLNEALDVYSIPEEKFYIHEKFWEKNLGKMREKRARGLMKKKSEYFSPLKVKIARWESEKWIRFLAEKNPWKLWIFKRKFLDEQNVFRNPVLYPDKIRFLWREISTSCLWWHNFAKRKKVSRTWKKI